MGCDSEEQTSYVPAFDQVPGFMHEMTPKAVHWDNGRDREGGGSGARNGTHGGYTPVTYVSMWQNPPQYGNSLQLK